LYVYQAGYSQFPEISQDLVFQRVQPNVISFNSAMNACGRGSQWPLAVALLQRMARQSLRPTAASFGAVVAATGRKGLWRMALLLMERMEDLGSDVLGRYPLVKMTFTVCELV
jgi:pentatricopeptide repeat protein